MLSTQKLVSFASSAGLVVLSFVPFVVSADERTRLHKLKGSNGELSYVIEVHGILLWASAGLLMPMSILIKRISNTQKSATKLRIIFYLHAITQVLAVLVAAAGGIMSIQYFDNSFNNNHQIIGLVFYGLIWLQTFVSFFRPHRGSRCRSIWLLFHWLVGITTCLIGVINIYTGLESYHKRRSKDVKIWRVIFIVEMCFILFVYLVQEKWHHLKKQIKDDHHMRIVENIA